MVTATANSLTGRHICLVAAWPGPTPGVGKVAGQAGGWCPRVPPAEGQRQLGARPCGFPCRSTPGVLGAPRDPERDPRTGRTGCRREALLAKAGCQPSSHTLVTEVPGNVGEAVRPSTQGPTASPEPKRFQWSI